MHFIAKRCREVSHEFNFKLLLSVSLSVCCFMCAVSGGIHICREVGVLPLESVWCMGNLPPGGVIGSSVWCQHPPILSPVESASFDQQREAVKQKFLKPRTGFTVPLHGQSLCKFLDK